MKAAIMSLIPCMASYLLGVFCFFFLRESWGGGLTMWISVLQFPVLRHQYL